MKDKILVTGPPRCGKSTLIAKLIEHYSNNRFKIYGFLTPEVREKGNRVGFDIVDIGSNMTFALARTSGQVSRFKVGNYSVYLEGLEQILDNIKGYVSTKPSPNDKGIQRIIIIDEIGKMELFSKKFQDFVKYIFQLEVPIIATIGEKIRHPIKDYVLSLPSVEFLVLTRDTQQQIFEKIIFLIHCNK